MADPKLWAVFSVAENKIVSRAFANQAEASTEAQSIAAAMGSRTYVIETVEAWDVTAPQVVSVPLA